MGRSLVTPRAERLGFLAWLVTSALFAYWFAWVAISALFHAKEDSGGNLVLFSSQAGHTAYPFTYAAAGLALVGIAIFIYVAERPRRDAPLIAALAAYLTCVGMINIYEQAFVACTIATTHNTYWWAQDFGNVNSVIFTAIGISWVAASAPWWKRENLLLAGLLFALFAASMTAWLAIGFPPIEQGSPVVYILNTVSRFASELIPLSLVLPPRYASRALTPLSRMLARVRAGRGIASPQPGESGS
jgi:hypothetical protein